MYAHLFSSGLNGVRQNAPEYHCLDDLFSSQSGDCAKIHKFYSYVTMAVAIIIAVITGIWALPGYLC